MVKDIMMRKLRLWKLEIVLVLSCAEYGNLEEILLPD
jgi:hypothetical protein